MKPAAAFAVGLWTGALVTAAVGVFYVHILGSARPPAGPDLQQQLEARILTLQQEQTNTTAEIQRLRQTVAELQSTAPEPAPTPPATMPVANRATIATPKTDWVDVQALPKLEEAAEQNDLAALDAVGLLADLDNAEALTRVWASPTLDATTRNRAATLLAATVEFNPHGEELLVGLAQSAPENAALIEAALTGLVVPNRSRRLTQGTDGAGQPVFEPDYALRLRIVDGMRAALTNPALLTAVDQARRRIAHRAEAAAALR